jgi:hypothetical protein
VAEDMAAADALRALSRVEGTVRVTRRIMPDDPASPLAAEPVAAVPGKEETSPAVPTVPEEIVTDSTHAAETVEPPAPAAPEPAPTTLRRVPMLALRRKARMTEVARIVIPPAPPPEPQPDPVSPPSFAVTATAGELLDEAEPTASLPTERPVTHALFAETAPEEEVAAPAIDPDPIEPPPAEPPPIEFKPLQRRPLEIPPVPEKQPTPEPVIEKAAPANASKPASTVEITSAETGPKSELMLANGERVVGRILRETPQALYVEHASLGVLTIPRRQIAQKPIEVILINGDRIVGDLIAENAECLYVRHASLGMLTVPHDQRSTRVVEVILLGGDRILGEVLAETDSYTVLRSATLGTVTVQHDRVAQMNRKLEQMPLKALPAPLADQAKSDDQP